MRFSMSNYYNKIYFDWQKDTREFEGSINVDILIL